MYQKGKINKNHKWSHFSIKELSLLGQFWRKWPYWSKTPVFHGESGYIGAKRQFFNEKPSKIENARKNMLKLNFT